MAVTDLIAMLRRAKVTMRAGCNGDHRVMAQNGTTDG